MEFPYDVCVVGAAATSGLPLAITFADRGLEGQRLRHQRAGRRDGPVGPDAVPGAGAEPMLREVIGRTLEVANDPALRLASRGTWSS